MELIVTDVTRMLKGYICVAGIDSASGARIRPVLPGNRRLRADLLALNGGPFAVGHWVGLPATRPVGRPPEIEDTEFDPARTEPRGPGDPAPFWDALHARTVDNLLAGFGPDLEKIGSTYSVPLGKGSTSLAIVWPGRISGVSIGLQRRVRLNVNIGGEWSSIAVTDARLYEPPDFQQPDDIALAVVQAKIGHRTTALLSLGLTRPVALTEGGEERHWLQVNGIHFKDDPLWQGVRSKPR